MEKLKATLVAYSGTESTEILAIAEVLDSFGIQANTGDGQTEEEETQGSYQTVAASLIVASSSSMGDPSFRAMKLLEEYLQGRVDRLALLIFGRKDALPFYFLLLEENIFQVEQGVESRESLKENLGSIIEFFLARDYSLANGESTRVPEGNEVRIPVYFATDRSWDSRAMTFGPHRSATGVAYGTADVSIPPTHRIGRLERPSIWRLRPREDAAHHFAIGAVEVLDEHTYLEAARANLAKIAPEILLFVHGYNVTFQEAILRAAQLAHDLNFAGLPVVFSWPSEGRIGSYSVDETNVAWAARHLSEYLKCLIESLELDRIHVLGHSMGSRAILTALKEIGPVLSGGQFVKSIQNVIFAAADVDAQTFLEDIPNLRVAAGSRITLYSSSRDYALRASRRLHKYRRAGESGEHLVIGSGLDTVDATWVDTSLMGHSYFSNSRTVLGDIFHLIENGLGPASRGLSSQRKGRRIFWSFPA